MAIQAITGVMGSGKSYELVKEHIAKTIRDEEGRRFITNVEGLNYEEIAKYCGRELSYVKEHLVSVSYERVAEPKFWYDPEGNSKDTVVQPGDVVGLDEIWRYFNRDVKLPADAMRFFRMHRHYASEKTGHTCDVVLVNQSFRGIHQDIRDVIEVQYNCRKLKVLGRPENYQVFVIEGGERKASHDFMRKYHKDVFPLYSSYSTTNAKEAMDKRQSVFSKGLFKFVLPAILLVSIPACWYAYNFLKSGGTKAQAVEVDAKGASTAETRTAQPLTQQATEDWRLVAVYRVGNEPVFVLVNGAGLHRTVAGVPFEIAGYGEIYPKIPPERTGYAAPWSGNFNTTKKGF